MILILDANNICHIAKHSTKDLSYKGENVGIIFGFLKQMFYLSDKFKTDKFIFAWDSRKSFRKQIYPEYKANRIKERTEEEIEFDKQAFKQFSIIRKEVLSSIGFKNNFIFTGYEADDIIGSIIRDNPIVKTVIVSSDSDLFQLLSPFVKIYRNKQTYSHFDFLQEWRIGSYRWIDVKAMAGCISDNIKGIEGIGEKTACKYLTRELNRKSKAFSSIIKSKDIIEKNKELVSLPFNGTPEVDINWNEKLLFSGFINVCKKYGFKYFMRRENLFKWKELFNME